MSEPETGQGKGTANEIEALVRALECDNSVARIEAREELVKRGGAEVTRALVGELVDPRKQVRWEAAKALTAIADPVAAPALLNALADEDEDVRWVAAEGLIALGRPGLLTVLSGLLKPRQSLEFYKAAHHVVHDLSQSERSEELAKVLDALEHSEPEAAAPPAAFSALQALKLQK